MKYGRLGTIARRKPPGRAEKSISFLCCDHSASDARMDSYQGTEFSDPTKIEQPYDGYLEIPRDLLKLIPRKRHAFDTGVFLGLQGDDSLIEYNTLIFFREHSHETLHEVLKRKLNTTHKASVE